MTELPNVPHDIEPAALAALVGQPGGAGLSQLGQLAADLGPAVVAHMLGAKGMDDWPACERRRDPNCCGAVLVDKVDDAHNRHIHYCHTDVKALHSEHLVMVNTEHAAEVAHVCGCGTTWVENTGVLGAEDGEAQP